MDPFIFWNIGVRAERYIHKGFEIFIFGKFVTGICFGVEISLEFPFHNQIKLFYMKYFLCISMIDVYFVYIFFDIYLSKTSYILDLYSTNFKYEFLYVKWCALIISIQSDLWNCLII